MKITIDEIADYIVYAFQKVGEPITNLKLQKLLYYAQAWYLALYEKILFEDDFEAWCYGPVATDQYYRFKKYGAFNIEEKIKKPDLPEQITTHLEEILDIFGGESAFELARMTHNEDPWKNARGNIPESQPCENIISKEDMKNYYQSLIYNDDKE